MLAKVGMCLGRGLQPEHPVSLGAPGAEGAGDAVELWAGRKAPGRKVAQG